MNRSRKIYYALASGGHNTDKHYFDTIQTKRNVSEFKKYMPTSELSSLDRYVHSRPFAVWGAIPGSGNNQRWESMDQGDYVMIYRAGKVIAVAEVAMKIRSSEVAEFLWGKDSDGQTWELVFFLTNEIEVNVEQKKLNKYLGYAENYSPRGFMSIEQEKAQKLLATYGDLLSLLQKLEKGDKLEEIEYVVKEEFQGIIEENIQRAPTEHDEMQWRLISLGNKASLDVWVPANDQGKNYEGNNFREHVIPEFQEALDVPIYVKNIDTVWKLGLSIKAAFEIENSTSIYSGILRLSDLRSLAPNSNYPLFIVADRNKKQRVFDQLRRPTFSNDYLHLDKVVRFMSYDSVRELDETIKEPGYDTSWLIDKSELLN